MIVLPRRHSIATLGQNKNNTTTHAHTHTNNSDSNNNNSNSKKRALAGVHFSRIDCTVRKTFFCSSLAPFYQSGSVFFFFSYLVFDTFNKKFVWNESILSIVSERTIFANEKQLNDKTSFYFILFFCGFCFYLLLADRFSFNEINLKIEWFFLQASATHSLIDVLDWNFALFFHSKCRHGPNKHSHIHIHRLFQTVQNELDSHSKINTKHNNCKNKWPFVVVVFIRAIEWCKASTVGW